MVEAFHGKDGQGMLPEGPFGARGDDCLGFSDYADVLVNRLRNPTAWPVGLGIYAQWGAGKVSETEELVEIDCTSLRFFCKNQLHFQHKAYIST